MAVSRRQLLVGVRPVLPVDDQFVAMPEPFLRRFHLPTRIRRLLDPALLAQARAQGLVAPWEEDASLPRLEQLFSIETLPRLTLKSLAYHLRPVEGVDVVGPAALASPRQPMAVDPDVDLQGYLAAPSSNPNPATGAGQPWGTADSGVTGAPGALGQGIRLVVMERGWHLKGYAPFSSGHDDLAAAQVMGPTWGKNSGEWLSGGVPTWSDLVTADQGIHMAARDHGLMNLGILAGGIENGIFGHGMVPKAKVRLVSSVHPTTRVPELYNGVLAACIAAGSGTVLLLEDTFVTTRNGLSVETPLDRDPLLRLFLRWARSKGATLVLPAGNSGEDLASLWWGSNILNFPIPSVPVVMVGGLQPDAHQTSPSSNWGSAVRFSAWGDHVHRLRVTQFNGTLIHGSDTDGGGSSAAAAILAGCAAAIAGMFLDRKGFVPSPSVVQTLLAYDATATLPYLGRSVGPMPNLAKVKALIATF